MRLIISIGFIAIFCTVGNAQSYHPLLSDSTRWNIVIGTGLGGGTSVITTTTDTIINGNVYKKLNPPRAILREDTTSKKVYARRVSPNPIVDTADYVLYDFSLVMGDSLYLIYPNLTGYNSVNVYDTLGLYKVDTIYSFLTIAGVKKRIDLIRTPLSSNDEINKTSWVEGVGEISTRRMVINEPEDLSTLYYSASYPSGQYGSFCIVKCVFQNGIRVFSDTGSNRFVYRQDSCFFAWADNVPSIRTETNPLKIHPNPANDKVNVSLENTVIDINSTIAIYSIQGVKVFQEQYRPNRPIDINSLPSGMYFIQLSVKGKQYNRKFIKN